jgi:hypothetical protein
MVHLNMPALKQPVKPVRSVFFTPDRFFLTVHWQKFQTCLEQFLPEKTSALFKEREE